MKKTTVDVSMTFQRALPENNNWGDVKIERSKPIRFRNSIITAFCPATRVIMMLPTSKYEVSGYV